MTAGTSLIPPLTYNPNPSPYESLEPEVALVAARMRALPLSAEGRLMVDGKINEIRGMVQQMIAQHVPTADIRAMVRANSYTVAKFAAQHSVGTQKYQGNRATAVETQTVFNARLGAATVNHIPLVLPPRQAEARRTNPYLLTNHAAIPMPVAHAPQQNSRDAANIARGAHIAPWINRDAPPQTLYLPSQSKLTTCLERVPVLQNLYYKEKGIIEATAKFFADKKIVLDGVDIGVFHVLSDLNGKISEHALLVLHKSLVEAVKTCAISISPGEAEAGL